MKQMVLNEEKLRSLLEDTVRRTLDEMEMTNAAGRDAKNPEKDGRSGR